MLTSFLKFRVYAQYIPFPPFRATSYAERIRLGIAVIHGENKESEADEQDGRHSPPPFVTDSEGAVAPLRTSNLGPESSCPNFEAINSAVPNGEKNVTANVTVAAKPARATRTRCVYVKGGGGCQFTIFS